MNTEVVLPRARDEAWLYTAPSRLVDGAVSGALPVEVWGDVVVDDGRVTTWGNATRSVSNSAVADGFDALRLGLSPEAVGWSRAGDVRIAVRRSAARSASVVNIDVADGCDSVVIIDHAGGGDGLSLAEERVTVARGGSLHLIRVIEGEGRHHGRVRADVAGSMKLTSIVIGSGIRRVEVEATLGVGAVAELAALAIVPSGAHADHHWTVHHAAPGARSRQVVRGLVHEDGRSAFTGRVIVHPGAVKTDAAQHCAHLLLGARGRVDARPQLEIRCDDVACTHGATVGRLDDEALFLLQARGIPVNEAKALLVTAFARAVLDSLPASANEVVDRIASWR